MECKETFEIILDLENILALEKKNEKLEKENQKLKKQICVQSLKLKNRNHG